MIQNKIEIRLTIVDNQNRSPIKYFTNWEEAAKFMRQYVDLIYWWTFSTVNKNIPDEIFRQFKDYIEMENYVINNNCITFNLAREFADTFDWYHWLLYHSVRNHIQEVKEKVKLDHLIIYQHLPMSFIKKYKEDIKNKFHLLLMNKNYSPDEQYKIQQILK